MEKLPDASGARVVPSMSFEAFRGNIVLSGKRKAVVTLQGQQLRDENLPLQIINKVAESNSKASLQGIPSNDVSDILPESPSLSQKIRRLNQKVETYAANFGYKGANLFILEEITAKLRNLGWYVHVPKFLAISHKQTQMHLQKNFFSFKTLMEQFVFVQKGKQELTEEGAEILQQLREGIRFAFDSHTLEDLDITGFKDERMLMVRSSGLEDSKEASMAGAYTSIAGVPKDIHEISKAIGAVIESYLSESSILHKLATGQDISDPFFTPVLLQEMIGEDINQIPLSHEVLRCGVCYTKEMGAETPDLTVIESAFGHNELVVNGGSCDTYYVYSTGENHQILEPKPNRLVANVAQNGESKFLRRKNPHELVNIGSLSTEAQNLIRISSSEIHDTYGCPMDIEWIYDPKEKALWIVQARPVVKKITLEPSMVDKTVLKDLLPADVIVHQGGQAVALTKRDQIICARTLANGCTRYLKLGGKRNPVRAIIVAEPAGRLSHPACVLRERGVTVIHCPNFDVHSLERLGAVILIDTQQGIIGQLKNPDFLNLDEQEFYNHLRKNSIITDGWFRHPIAAQESLQDYGLDETDIRALLHNLWDGGLAEQRNISDLISSLCSENIEKGNRAVKTLTVTLLKHLMKISKKTTPLEKHLFDEGTTLLRNILIVGNQLLNRTERKQRLHIAKRLEALCYQEVSSRVLHSISVRTLLSKHQLALSVPHSNMDLSDDTKGGLKLLESNTQTKLQRLGTTKEVLQALKEPLNDTEKAQCQLVYQSMLPLLLGDQAQEEWQRFTQTLMATESRIANQLCVDLLTQIERSGILTEWMMHSFVPCASRVQDPIGILQALRDEWGKVRKTMKDVILLSSTFDTWKHNPTIWEDPLTFDALWMAFKNGAIKELQKAIENLLGGQHFTYLEKVLLCNAIGEGIETFDIAIKTMRGSSIDKPEQRVAHFSKMLTPYLSIMVMLIEAIPEKTFARWASSALVDNKQLTLPLYKAGIISLIKSSFERCCKSLNAKQLEPSEHFNVQAACINSGTFFNLEFKGNQVTLEDLFTLIHQNIFAALECHRPRLDQTQFPREALLVMNCLGQIDDSMEYSFNKMKLQTHLVSESLRYPLLIATYNFPIKNHSCKLTITYHLKNRESEASCEMYGHNLNRRMELIGAKVIFQSAMEGLRILEFPHYDETIQTLKMKWKVGSDPNRLKRLIIEAAKDTLRGNFGNITTFERNELPNLDPAFWQNLLNNSSSFRRAFEGPGQYTIISILAYFLEESCTVSLTIRARLLEELGILIKDQQKGETFERLLFEAFCSHLLEDKENILMEQVGMMMLPVHPIKRLLIKLLDHLLASEKNLVEGFREAIAQNYAALLPILGSYPTSEDHFFVLLVETFGRCCIKCGNLTSIKICAQFLHENEQLGCLATLLSLIEIMRHAKEVNPLEVDELILWLKELIK